MSTTTTSTDMTVANTIIEQLGRGACFMMNARQFVGDASSVRFKIMPNAKKVTHVVITLAADDTYTIAFWNVRGLKVKTLAECDGVYVDAMRRTIEEHTGLVLTVPTIRRA